MDRPQTVEFTRAEEVQPAASGLTTAVSFWQSFEPPEEEASWDLFTTKSDFGTRKAQQADQKSQIGERELRSVAATVLDITHDLAAVEFEDGLTVDFPKALLDSSLLKPGQPVDYVVKSTGDGRRFQMFRARPVRPLGDEDRKALAALKDAAAPRLNESD